MNNASNVLDTLRPILKKTAEQVAAAHSKIDRSLYAVFLNTMYHYTLKSQERLEYASEICPSEDLKEFFSHLAEEEASHYVLAEADLKSLGAKLDKEHMPQSVANFEAYWNSIGADRYAELIGALYILESVGDELQALAAKNIAKLGVDRTQVRFVMVHLKEDQEHGKGARDLCEKYWKSEPEALLKGAEEASKHWVAIMTEGFHHG